MAGYISSNENRFYAGMETSYGVVPAVTARDRFPAVKLSVRHWQEQTKRKDKTGSRTFAGVPAGGRQSTTFDLSTYLTSWDLSSRGPAYGALFAAAMGGVPLYFPGAVAGAGCSGRRLVKSGTTSLVVGQAVSFGGEIRFVSRVISGTAFDLNAPFSISPTIGSPLGPTMTYLPGTDLPSISLFDYWNPATAVQRIVCGAAVDQMEVTVNGDYHTFAFRGNGMDVIDSASFASGHGGLAAYPSEPDPGAWTAAIVPGNLGEAWIGNGPDQFLTITEAKFRLENALDMRAREFGSAFPRGVSAGMRSVTVNLNLFEQDNPATAALYSAACGRTPIPVMFQLGQQAGQLFGICMTGVVPEVPEFDDSETRLAWSFGGCHAQGTVDDEISVAFA